MKEIVIDLRTNAITHDVHSGHTGFISWRRLFDEELRNSGEIKPHEQVIIVRAHERGISFIVTKRDGK